MNCLRVERLGWFELSEWLESFELWGFAFVFGCFFFVVLRYAGMNFHRKPGLVTPLCLFLRQPCRSCFLSWQDVAVQRLYKPGDSGNVTKKIYFMTRLLPLLFCLLPAFLFCQNLVPNPSFEDHKKSDFRWSGNSLRFNNSIELWHSPTQGSPDVLLHHNKDKLVPPRPKVNMKPHFARTGVAMVGLKTYGCATNNLHCKEYLQIRLKETVAAGDSCYYEFWVSTLASGIKVNRLGVAVSATEINEPLTFALLDTEHHFEDDKMLTAAPNVWEKISGTFIAPTVVNYLLIGSFVADAETQTEVPEDGVHFSYYMIDDVFLQNFTRPLTPEKYVLEHIYFAFNEAELLPASFSELDKLLNRLKEKPEQRIRLTGHTSDEGTEDYNLDLSVRRAGAVAAYLRKNGIAAERIDYGGRGSTEPRVANDTEENRKKNRRTEAEFL